MKEPVSRKWTIEVSLDDDGYATVRVNPDLTIRELRRWIWQKFTFHKEELPSKELLAVVERALVDPAGQYTVFVGDKEPLWLRWFKEISGG